jgi:hypothetical protein
MNTYEIVTLVDITRTQARRDEIDKVKKFQQANFDSLRQAIELRSNVEWVDDPTKFSGRLPDNTVEGKANYWCWQFSVERDLVFESDGDPVALLKQDINGVPVIAGLEETAELTPSAFITQGKNINIWFTIIT